MKLLLTILILIFMGFSSVLVTADIVSKVEKNYGKFAKNRFLALEKLINDLKDKSDEEKLEKVNDFFNNVAYQSDQKTYGTSDYWATPYEFLARDRGDCEDYVIAKYFTLKQLGIPTSKLYLTYVTVKAYGEAHMVLTYFKTPKTMPLVLDSLNRRIFPASKRSDLVPVYNFNPDILQDGKKTTAHKKWDTLMQHIKEYKI